VKVLFKNGTIVTMNPKREILTSDLLVENGLISKIDRNIQANAEETIDCTDEFIIPGLIQCHTHLCQTLFRGLADDLVLLDWLEKKIWPLESSHTPETLRDSAEFGLLEMQLCGTTTILDMGTVNHTEALFDVAGNSGIRYFGGNCLMDEKNSSGPLYKETQESLKECEELSKKIGNKGELINYVLSPRFAVCCSEEILKACRDLQKDRGLRVHIHASENKDEIAFVKKKTGLDNVSYLGKLSLLNPQTILVHGVHLSESEVDLIVQSKTGLVHCPSANLKLASGIAPIEKYSKKGMILALGSDGAACNNIMDPFKEIHLSSMLQKPDSGPTAMPAARAFELATLGGAKVLGIEDKVGSLEAGKKADIVTISRKHPSQSTVKDPYSALVFSCSGRDVTNVMTNGRWTVRKKEHCFFDFEKVTAKAQATATKFAEQI
jgi:5-methylthioadenosine/S-adenosylhomocysteine deaminase